MNRLFISLSFAERGCYNMLTKPDFPEPAAKKRERRPR